MNKPSRFASAGPCCHKDKRNKRHVGSIRPAFDRFPGRITASYTRFMSTSQRELPRSADLGRPEKISVVGGSNGEKGTHLSCASIGGDYSKAKGSSWDMGGATGGGRDGIPRWSRILRVICGG